MKRRGFLVVLSGPSGAGKNTLLNAVLPRIPDLKYSVSATTRPPRPGERDGVDYFFLDDAAFDAMIARDEFLEWAEFAGYRYGTPRRFVEECLAQGYVVITDVDIQGARQIKEKMPDGVFVFLLPPSMEELQRRLESRGTESAEAISRRLKIALEEVAAIVDYDYWILNNYLEEACEQLVSIIRAERARVCRTDFSTLPLKGE